MKAVANLIYEIACTARAFYKCGICSISHHHGSSFPSYWFRPGFSSQPATWMLMNLPLDSELCFSISASTAFPPSSTDRSALSPPKSVRSHCGNVNERKGTVLPRHGCKSYRIGGAYSWANRDECEPMLFSVCLGPLYGEHVQRCFRHLIGRNGHDRVARR